MSVGTGRAATNQDGEGHGGVARYHGKYPAVVVDHAPDGDGAHRGDLLVAIPAILEDDPSPVARDASGLGIETNRVDGRRPIQVLAKPCFAPGAFFLPEPGHHVWVEFAAGDVNEPLWSGVWLPRDATPRTSDDEAPTTAQRVIRSTSGHVIELDDREDAERLVIRDHKGSTVVLDEGGIHVDTDGDVEIHASTVSVTCDRMTVNGDLRVTDGSRATTISGNEITGA